MSNQNKTGIHTTKQASKIIGIQFSVLSPEEIRKSSVAHITSRDTYMNNKPVPNGLFDARMGVLEPGLICPTDGLDYIQTPGYFGHIELARPMFYIQYLTHIIKILRCVCYKCSKLLINKEKYKHVLEMDSKLRWDAVFELASSVKVCGDENDDGCGCKQPKTIRKTDFATIVAKWNESDLEEMEVVSEVKELVLKITPEMALRILKRISDEDVHFMGFSPVFSRPEWMICEVLAVPPPAIRPSVKHDAQQRSEDDITHIIVDIIKANNSLHEKITQNAKQNVIEDWSDLLQYRIATMINNKIPGVAPVSQRSGRPLKSIMERLNGKHGRVRGNLMGKRVDYSARSVITGDPNISIRELGIPKPVAMNITYPIVVNQRNKDFLTQLVRNGPEIYPGAKILERKTGEQISLRYVDRESMVLNNGDIVHRHMLNGDHVLFNRQPTLHRMSMMCHVAKIMNEGNTFRMNVADTKPYNADYDGDEMNMHMPQDEESYAELRHLAAVPRQIISPANNSPIVGIFQDSLLSSYRITRDFVNFDLREAMNLLMAHKYIKPELFMKARRDGLRNVGVFELMSQILPPISIKYKNNSYGDNEDVKTTNNIVEIVNGVMKRGQFDKSIKKILQVIFNDYGHEACADFVDGLQNIVTAYMLNRGFSVGISDLIADKETNNKIAESITKRKNTVKDIIHQTQIGVFENTTGQTNVDEFESQVNSLLNEARSEAGKIGKKSLDSENRFVVMTSAGSKGSDINIAQMISCLGQQNVDGKRIPYGFEDRTLPHYTKFDDSPEARGFVENSFIQGLTPQELFFHAMGGRVGLIDTAVKTSQTGYIQRRLIKGMEDLKVEYDMTVRNNMGKIIQFQYGDDSVETIKVESQSLPLVKMTLEEIYTHYDIPSDELTSEIFTTNYTKDALSRMRKQKDALKDKVMETIERMLEVRDDMVDNVFKGEMNSRVNMPVNIMRIIENVQKQLHIQGNSMVDITPLECYEAVEDCKKQLNMLGTCKPQRLFYALLDYYLSPNEMLMKYRFNKIAMKTLTTQIVSYYMKSIINPGEMVGIIAAQSIGEPTTQMSCISSEKMRIMKKHKVTGIVSSVHIPIGELCDEIITNNPEQTHNTGHEDSVETSLDNDQYEYYIVGVSSDEKTYWNKISHVSRHPVNGRLLEFKTRSGRSTITTASHSHLKRDVDTQKVVPIRGDKLELGMRIPVCKSLKDSERPISYKNTIDFYGNKSIELDAITKQPLGKFIGMILASLTQSNRKNEIDLLCPSKETYFDVKDIMDKATLPYTQNHSVESESEPDFEPLYNEIIINDADFVNYIKTTFYNKHNKLCVPEFMFEMDKECISGMLQALFDKCSYIQNSIRLFTNENVSMEMLYDIAFLLYEFDIFSVFRHQTENQKHGELSIPAKYGETFRTEIGTTHKFNTMSLSDMIVYQQKNKHTLREDIDLIPGVGHIIADIGHFLRMPNSAKNYGRWRSKPHIGRRTLKKYINNFESAILNNDVCKEEMDNLRQAAFSNVVWDEIIEIKEVDATQEKYVYDFTVPGNQTFMNDTGLIVHNTLNTFHSAGISSKSNVTRGVPRIEEILSLTKNPKNPSMTVHMKGDDVYDKQKAQQMKYILEYTSMRDIVDSVTICFDPDSLNTLIEEDKELVSQFMAFEKMTKEAADESISSEEKNASKWILRFELNKDSMLDRNITMDDVYFALKNGYKEEFHCIYSDYNADKLIMRIRFLEALKKSKTSIGYSSHKELDQSDYIYVLKNIQENLLDNVVLKGVHDIPNVNIRKLQNQIVKQDGDYVAKDKWVLDTVGSNLLGILGKDDIDATKTITNDIVEVRNILGVEAARQVIYNEFAEVIEFDGTYINYHHLSMLCDRMCCKHELVSIFRYGITNDDIGPIAKASFEQTPEMFLRAARHGEFDNMRGVSASVMTGQKGNFGTSSFQVVLDMEEMMKQEKKTLKKETTIEDMFELRDEEGEFCSVQNISKHDNVKLLKEANVGDLDDDYEMDF